MSLAKSRGNSERMAFKCSRWSCVKLVEVVVGVSLMKFCTMIDSVDGFFLNCMLLLY